MRDEIVNGQPVWLAHVVTRQRVRDLKGIDTLPIPRTDAAIRLRSALVDALARHDEAGVASVVAQLPMLRPDDREAAAWSILRHLGHPAVRTIEHVEPAAPTAQVHDPVGIPDIHADELPLDSPMASSGSIAADEAGAGATQPSGDAIVLAMTSTAASAQGIIVALSRPPPDRRRRNRHRHAPNACQGDLRQIADILILLKDAERLMNDDLAVAIHHGSRQVRAITAAILPALKRRSRRLD